MIDHLHLVVEEDAEAAEDDLGQAGFAQAVELLLRIFLGVIRSRPKKHQS